MCVCVCGSGGRGGEGGVECAGREQILTRFGFLHCEYLILGTAVLKWAKH